jgi:predicted transcriptional regulator
MASMKTTVYLDASEYRRLKALAATEGRPAADLIRAAVSDYVRTRGTQRRPTSLGAGRSGDGSLSETAEALLEDFGDES